ncbi:hypothetical protein ACROYT_G016884 [Oculina patagonica]
MIKVQDDILRAIDNNCCVILLLLDLSAAFDTVDHRILLDRLSQRFGIVDNALEWFRSYLSDRHQVVKVNGSQSSRRKLRCGVPQGSVLGPILFLLYTSPLGDIMRYHQVKFHLYADDTQLYLTFKSSPEMAKTAMEACVRDIDTWMTANMLKMNRDKTELLVLKARHRPLPPLTSISVCDEDIDLSSKARNIGVIFDTSMSMENHITAICKSAFYHLRNISRIRKYLSFHTAEMLVHAFVSSRLDFCNSLLFGLPKQTLKKLQHVQNVAARIVTLTRKCEHITPVLYNLHWLPIEERIIFKLLLITFKCLRGLAPTYLSDMIKRYVPRQIFLTNVVVVQISATPFNLLTQNSRLPVVRCVLLNDNISTEHNAYKAGDLVVLEPNLEKHVKNDSKKVELHVVHWSEVELKNFERGMRMKLKSALNIEDVPYQYLCVSSDGKLSVTSSEDKADDFIVQGSNGIVILKVFPTKEKQKAKRLTICQDALGNLEAKDDPKKPTKFEVKLDFGVGVVAFGSCEKQHHYIAVDEHGYVSLKAAKVERTRGVSIMKPLQYVARVSYHFFMDRCGPAEVDVVGKQYMNLNFYLSTMNGSTKNEQKIREDENFQKIVDRAKKQTKMSKTGCPSFSIDALLCAEYCYHILHASVFDSDKKIRRALTSTTDESPATEFNRKLDAFVRTLKNEGTINPKKYIAAEAFEFVRNELCDKATHDFQNNLKNLSKLTKRSSTKEKQEDLTEVEEDLTISFVACLMHLDQQKLQKVKEIPCSSKVVEEIKQNVQNNNYQVMVQLWNSIIQEDETSSLVRNLIQSGKGKMGKMKIVRAKSGKTADQFYFTLRLARTESCFEERFEVIKDYGGIQIENQLMKSSSPFFRKLQTGNCQDHFDCSCKTLRLEEGRKKCSECHHVHKLITQYEDLDNLACVLILVDKGRMGDTFPQSFNCLDLRLSYDKDEGSSLCLSTVIQELGRMCRYSKSPANDSPYVLVGRSLFKTLRKSLESSPSMNAISCNNVDRYMITNSKRKDETCLPLRWLGHKAHKDSYDYENEQKHPNRILLQAEPQIGKTGTYLCLIRDLRLDILGKEKCSVSSAPVFDEGIFYHEECDLSEERVVSETEKRQDWQFPYWKTIQNSRSLNKTPVAPGKYSIGGCVYTHETEENPYVLLKQNGQKLAKSKRQYQKRECADSERAWHWDHFEKCAECGRLLQGEKPVLETFEVHIDGRPVTVKVSIPSSRHSFKHLYEQLKNTRSTEQAVKELSTPTLLYWIFHASHRDDPRKCTLNYHHVMQENGQIYSYVQVAVVRSEKFKAYRSTWGKVLAIVQLPDTLPNCDLGPSEGGVGYARLFIQKMAFALNQEYIFMIDDNVVAMSEAVFSTGNASAVEGRVVRDENGVMQMQRCSFLKPLKHLQKIVQGKATPAIDEGKYEPHPLKEEFKSQEVPLYSYTGPAKLFRNKQHESYGILGLMRSFPVAVNPFSKTQVYAAILLNVKSTVAKGVFYRPWPCWEDLRFNDDCDKARLWVVKCNRYSFLKVQYKDWISNLAISKIFEWNDDSILKEKPPLSELPKELEEGIILEYLRNLVNIQGPEKCFKGCIGYDRQKAINDSVSPARIVEQVNAMEGTKEAFDNKIPVLILSYCATNLTLKTLNVLSSRFCATKEKIVFVAAANEVIEEFEKQSRLQVTLATIPNKIGFCSEMRDRKAEFAVLSAADPKRQRLRYILIEASFPQDEGTNEGETSTIRERNQLNTIYELHVEESTSSDDTQPGTQQVSKEKKSGKRLDASFRDTPSTSVLIKRPNITEDNSGDQVVRPSNYERKYHFSPINTLKRKLNRGNDSIQSEGCRHQETSQEDYDILGIDKGKRKKTESAGVKAQHNSDESLINIMKKYGATSEVP